MFLTKAQVTSFRSIENSGAVPIDDNVTVLVGQNESGKTAFLQALYKAVPVDTAKFDVTADYPRKNLNAYEKHHETDPEVAVTLTYQLTEDEVSNINNELGANVISSRQFSIQHKYDNSKTVTLPISETEHLQRLVKEAGLSSEVRDSVLKTSNIIDLIAALEEEDLNTEGRAFLEGLKEKYGETPKNWQALSYYIWRHHLCSEIPKFLYFDDYYLLPGKINIEQLHKRIAAQDASGIGLENEDKTVLSLLKMAGVDVASLAQPAGYEKIKARLEGISNSISDQVFKYWTQNRELEVEFDIRQDPEDTPPYSSGYNLYIRIRNKRHRVSVPFSQRSKGFIWFFSFLVWFGSIKQHLGTDNLILLLDEPGLSLHALAQADLLRYVDELADNHQIVYTTHSPFMVHSDRLDQVRAVEDKISVGTVISENVSGSDAKTVFPLQAALGYTIAQNLFISPKNLLVEGPADLIYLKYFSALLESNSRNGLREDVTIVPAGGLDKIATFVALLHGNNLQLIVLHDFKSKPDPRLMSLIQQKLIRDKQVLNYAMFRIPAEENPDALIDSDIEDMMSPSYYLKIFNETFKTGISENKVSEQDLPPGVRIVARIEEYLQENSIQLRPSGGFNHYSVASVLASKPVKPDNATIDRFEELFETINRLFN